MPASGRRCASPQHVTARWHGPVAGQDPARAPRCILGMSADAGGSSAPGGAAVIGGSTLHVIRFGCAALATVQSQGQEEGAFSRHEFSLGLSLLPL